MSSLFIEVAGRRLRIGGTWRLVDNATDVKAVRAEAGRAVVLEVPHQNDRSVVTYPREGGGAVAYSAGALVANLAPDVFVSHAVDGTTRWVFAAVNGAPLPGFDKLVRTGEVAAILEEARMGGAELALIGDVEGAEKSLEELVQGADVAAWKAASLKQPRVLMWAGVGVVAVTSLALAGVYGSKLMAQHEAGSVAAQPAASPVVITPAPMPSPASAPAVSPPPPSRFAAAASINAVLAVLRKLPASVQGWTPSEVSCQIHAGSCTVSWAAGEGAMPEGAAAIPGVELTTQAAIGRRVQSKVAMEVAPSGLVQALEPASFLSLFSVGVAHSRLNPMYAVTVDSAPKPATAGPGLSVAAVKANAPLWMWKTLAKELSPHALTFEEVAVRQLDGVDPVIQLVGSAYVASPPAPTPEPLHASR